MVEALTLVGPCKPKSESWISPISILDPESLLIWKMNPRKVIWNLNPKTMKNFESGILSNVKFEPEILPSCLNPQSVWNLNVWPLDAPYRSQLVIGNITPLHRISMVTSMIERASIMNYKAWDFMQDIVVCHTFNSSQLSKQCDYIVHALIALNLRK